MSNSSFRYRGLDGLRGLAALAVFGVHFNQIVDVDVLLGPFDMYLLLTNGEHGVALFFILSGALLSMPFWASILFRAESPDLKTYALRRLARIVPAYYLALTLLIVLTEYWRYPQAWPDIALHYSFLFNYADFSIMSVNPPFWTVAVEMQFYLLLPIVFLLLNRPTLRGNCAVLIALGLMAYGLHYGLVAAVEKAIYWPDSTALMWIRPHGAVLTQSLLAHLPHFIIGVMCGGLLLQLRHTRTALLLEGQTRFDALFGLSLALVLMLLATDLGDSLAVPDGRYSLPTVPVLLALLVLSAPLSRLVGRSLESAPLQSLGLLSYGIYIYHLPVMHYVDRVMTESGRDAAEQGLLFAVTALALTLVAATASYYFLERPVLRWAHQAGAPG